MWYCQTFAYLFKMFSAEEVRIKWRSHQGILPPKRFCREIEDPANNSYARLTRHNYLIFVLFVTHLLASNVPPLSPFVYPSDRNCYGQVPCILSWQVVSGPRNNLGNFVGNSYPKQNTAQPFALIVEFQVCLAPAILKFTIFLSHLMPSMFNRIFFKPFMHAHSHLATQCWKLQQVHPFDAPNCKKKPNISIRILAPQCWILKHVK